MSTASVISVVDDHASVRASMSNFLRSFGYVVHTFGSAEEFLGSACLSDTSCVISDLQMSPMSGLELLPKAKAMRPDVPIIMITAYGDADTKRKALENGAEALLTKPIDFGALRSEIDTRVERPA